MATANIKQSIGEVYSLTNTDHANSLSVLILEEEAALAETSSLSKNEKEMLFQCEKIITNNLNSFFQVGEALASIRKGKLYRDKYKSFEAYCRDKWKFGRHRALQFIEASEVASDLLTKDQQISDLNVHQLRKLTDLDANEKAEALTMARGFAGDKKLTSTLIETAVKALKNPSIAMTLEENQQVASVLPETNKPVPEKPEVTEEIIIKYLEEVRELLDERKHSQHLLNAFGLLESVVITFVQQNRHSPTQVKALTERDLCICQ
jgi:hypothetical protein